MLMRSWVMTGDHADSLSVNVQGGMAGGGGLHARTEGFLTGLLLGVLGWAAYGMWSRRKRKSFMTDDRSLFYGPIEQLAQTPPDAKFLPKELYGQAVRLLPILCIDILLERKSDGRFLLVKRGTEPVKGYWWVPGGRILRGETFFAAALRKAQEECGVKAATPKSVIGVYNTFFPTSAWGGGTHTINVGVHLVTDDADVVLDATSEEHRWVSRREAEQYDGYVQELLREI